MDIIANKKIKQLGTQLSDITNYNGEIYTRNGQEVAVDIFHEESDLVSFEGQLKVILSTFNPITLQQFKDWYNKGTSLPERPVLVTFDDGYANWYTGVKPILEKYSCPAVFFIATGWINGDVDIYPGKSHLTWAQCIEMNNSLLFDIQDHTFGHVNMLNYTKDQASTELSKSIALFQQNMGYKPSVLAYPFGFYNSNVINAVKELGYIYAFRVATHGAIGNSGLPATNLPVVRNNTRFELNRDGLYYAVMSDYYENMLPKVDFQPSSSPMAWTLPTNGGYATDGADKILQVTANATSQSLTSRRMPVSLGDVLHIEYFRKATYTTGTSSIRLTLWSLTETFLSNIDFDVVNSTDSDYVKKNFDIKITTANVGWVEFALYTSSDNTGTVIKMKQPTMYKVRGLDSIGGSRKMIYTSSST